MAKPSVVVFCALLLCAASAKCRVEEADYLGTLDSHWVIGLTLMHDSNGQLHGSYFHKQDLKDISLKGEYTGEREVILREYDLSAAVGGVFQLHFAEKDPQHHYQTDASLREDVMVGTWTNADRTRTYPVYLIMHLLRPAAIVAQEDPVLEPNAQAFYFAVLKGDRESAARHARYPLHINFSGEKLAANKAEFLRLYDHVFTRDYIACIEKGIPHRMFQNWRGAMIANGAIWFDEKGYAIALNSCMPGKDPF